jgi:hypothetical protein
VIVYSASVQQAERSQPQTVLGPLHEGLLQEVLLLHEGRLLHELFLHVGLLHEVLLLHDRLSAPAD